MDEQEQKKTEYTISNYVRNMQNIFYLEHNNNSYYTISNDIIKLFIKYIGEHFAERYKEFVLRIPFEPTLSQMVKAVNCQKFRSPIFEFMQTKWFIDICPS